MGNGFWRLSVELSSCMGLGSLPSLFVGWLPILSSSSINASCHLALSPAAPLCSLDWPLFWPRNSCPHTWACLLPGCASPHSCLTWNARHHLHLPPSFQWRALLHWRMSANKRKRNHRIRQLSFFNPQCMSWLRWGSSSKNAKNVEWRILVCVQSITP